MTNLTDEEKIKLKFYKNVEFDLLSFEEHTGNNYYLVSPETIQKMFSKVVSLCGDGKLFDYEFRFKVDFNGAKFYISGKQALSDKEIEDKKRRLVEKISKDINNIGNDLKFLSKEEINKILKLIEARELE
ncbi:MAG: hypothetical protein LC122_12155 [Chitinophagales bacterium]|nr:hypothetical protein [Chitinophagales bacterium]